MGNINLTKKTVNLSKGQSINLTKESDASKIHIGLGWDPYEEKKKNGFFSRLFSKVDIYEPKTIDCDAWVGLFNKSNGNSKLVYYGDKKFEDNNKLVVKHFGDNLTGDGDGDDEVIEVDLSKVPKGYDNIVVGVTIFRGNEKRQSFGNIKNTFIRIVDTKYNFEICRYDTSDMKAGDGKFNFIAGSFVRVNGEWEFKTEGVFTNEHTIQNAFERYKGY